MNWEIEPDLNSDYYCQRIIKLLTGFDLDEIFKYLPKNKERFKSKDFKHTLQSLGFNISHFKRFNPDTEKPVLMRCNIYGKKSGDWYVFVYCDKMVYIPGYAPMNLAKFKFLFRDLKITTMMEVFF